MRELLINKTIGSDWWEQYSGVSEEVSARYVREQLAAFPEDERELRIVIDSPGGDVFEGITIFNIIRDFVRAHPGVNVETYIQGVAASMASVVALAAWAANPERNKVAVEDNSVFMIHNAWNVAVGDRHELRDAADFLEEVDAVLRGVYMRRTGRSEADIGALMDAETWLWGAEIRDAGFADSVIEYKPEGAEPAAKGAVPFASRDFCVMNAKAKFGEAQKLMQKVCASADKANRGDYHAAALALGMRGGSPSAAVPGNAPGAENKKGGCMKITVEELKRDNPDVYAAVAAEGEATGVKKEQARANRLLAMGEKSHCTDYALECIRNGANPADDAVVDAFMEKGVSARALAAQALDEKDIPPVNPPKADKNADAKALSDAFDKGLKDGGYDYGDD